MKRAIISVSDKTGVAEFAKGLAAKGYEIISTGGTAALLKNSGVQTMEVETVTHFPECLDGRVKTLHPFIHGGVLAVRENQSHMETLEKLGIETIDLICVNLYPFKQTIAKKNHTLAEAVENIDIGGPSLLRAGSKNYKYVAVVTDIADYAAVLEQMDDDGAVPSELCFKLAAKAFAYTAAYDAYIAQYLAKAADGEKFPEKLTLTFERRQPLRYGENSHQQAAFYEELSYDGSNGGDGCVTAAKFLHGKELSYNNINDVDGALGLVKEFSEPACVAVKHATPCAVALGADAGEAYRRAFESDPVSIFGGVLAFNTEVTAECAEEINKTFIEVVIAPSYADEAVEILKQKKNIRILLLEGIRETPATAIEFKKVSGGLLLQDKDAGAPEAAGYVTKKTANAKELADLTFAMKVCKHVKSNAIVIAKDGCTAGIGGGSVSRIWAAEAAAERAGEKAKGAVMASDAFFPFDDVVKVCAKAGVTAIIQPGGSLNDDISVKACDEAGIAMIFTGVRHFRH